MELLSLIAAVALTSEGSEPLKLSGPTNATQPPAFVLSPFTPPIQEEEEEEKLHAFGFDWEGRISAGATVVAGNSRSTTISTDAEIHGTGEDDRILIRGGYLGQRTKDPVARTTSTTARRGYFDAKYDYFFQEDLYAYGLLDAERDGIRAIDLRYTVGVGAGYQFIEGEERNLNAEAGLGWTEENFKRPTQDVEYVSARAAVHFDTVLGENAEFFHDTEWIASLEDFTEDHLVRTVTGIRAGIVGNLSMEAKVLWDWDSSPAAGNTRRDVQYIFGLTWTF